MQCVDYTQEDKAIHMLRVWLCNCSQGNVAATRAYSFWRKTVQVSLSVVCLLFFFL